MSKTDTNTKFNYLLNAFEAASQADDPVSLKNCVLADNGHTKISAFRDRGGTFGRAILPYAHRKGEVK